MLKNVRRYRILLIIGGIVGTAALVIAGILFFQRDPDGQGESKAQYQKQLVFESAVGKAAPDFSLTDSSGKAVVLNDLLGKNVVLFFNEGLMCYPCIVQTIALTGDERLNNNGTVSYSIVTEPRETWQRAFEGKADISELNILFDVDGKVSQSYDILELPSSMHKGARPGHTYVIVDKTGIVRLALDDTSMGIRNDELVREIERIVQQ